MRRILADFYLKFSFPGVSLPRVFLLIFYLDEHTVDSPCIISPSEGTRPARERNSFLLFENR